MILHLLKMVWHRKRANALVMAEIFVSFLIVFAVATLSISLLSRWRAPLGFDWRNVWVMEVNGTLDTASSTKGNAALRESEEQKELQQAALVDRLMREIRSFPEVEAVGADGMTPYSENTWNTVMTAEGRHVLVHVDRATDDFARAMRIEVLRGRWFAEEDEAQSYIPIVVDTDAARALFGTEDAVGRKFASEDVTPGQSAQREYRVIGVIPPYRLHGELSSREMKMVFLRASMRQTSGAFASRVVVRVRPGTPASFEAELNRRLRRGGSVSLSIQRLEEMRRLALKMRLTPVILLGVIAVFLISMVALGLTGVLWQTVTRRMREMGLRRAVGATGTGVRAQVLGEVAVLSTLSLVVGAIVVLQLPLLGAFSIVTPGEFGSGFAGALAVIYAITMLCGGYPSWLASRIDPAEALRHD